MFQPLRRIVTLVLALGALASCEDRPQSPAQKLGSAPSALDAASAKTPPDAGAPRVVGTLRREKLEVGTRALPAESIAFAKSHLIHLGERALLFNALPDLKVVSEVALKEPRRLAVLRDGSTLALCASETVLVTERKHEVLRLPRVPLFAQSQVLPDLHAPRRFWVLHAFDAALYGYELDDENKLEVMEPREIKDYDRRVFAPLRDGSFLHTEKDGLVRMFLAGKRQALNMDVAGAFRLLPARRLDQIWIARDSGKLERVQMLAAKPRTLSSFEVAHVFDVAASDKNLGVLRMQRADAGRIFAVELYTPTGKLLWSDTLEFAVERPEDDAWVAQLSRDRGVALSQSGKWLAVGGPGAVVLWDATSGKRVLTR